MALFSVPSTTSFDILGGYGAVNQDTKSETTIPGGLMYGLEAGYIFLDRIGVNVGIYNFPAVKTKNSSKVGGRRKYQRTDLTTWQSAYLKLHQYFW